MILFSWLRSFSPPVGGRGGEQMAEIAKISQMGRFPEVTRMEAAFLQDDFSIHSMMFILLFDSLLLSQCDFTSHWPLDLCKMSPMQHPELHPHQSMLTRQGCTVHTMQCTPYTPCTLCTLCTLCTPCTCRGTQPAVRRCRKRNRRGLNAKMETPVAYITWQKYTISNFSKSKSLRIKAIHRRFLSSDAWIRPVKARPTQGVDVNGCNNHIWPFNVVYMYIVQLYMYFHLWIVLCALNCTFRIKLYFAHCQTSRS